MNFSNSSAPDNGGNLTAADLSPRADNASCQWASGKSEPLAVAGLVIVASVGVAGNCFGIGVMSFSGLLRRSPIFSFFLAISLADLLAIGSLVLEICLTLGLAFPSSALQCRFRYFLPTTAFCVSANLLATVSVEWLCMLRATVRRSRRRILLEVAGVVLVSSGINCHSVFTARLLTAKESSANGTACRIAGVCVQAVGARGGPLLKAWSANGWLLLSVLPLVVMATASGLLIRTVGQRLRQLNVGDERDDAGATSRNACADQVAAQNRRLTRTLVSILLLFLVFNLPYYLVTGGWLMKLAKRLSGSAPLNARAWGAAGHVCRFAKLANHCLSFSVYPFGSAFRQAAPGCRSCGGCGVGGGGGNRRSCGQRGAAGARSVSNSAGVSNRRPGCSGASTSGLGMSSQRGTYSTVTSPTDAAAVTEL